MPARNRVPISTRTLIRRATVKLMRSHREMSLSELRARMEVELDMTLRLDLILSNLLGLAGLGIDLESSTLIRL